MSTRTKRKLSERRKKEIAALFGSVQVFRSFRKRFRQLDEGLSFESITELGGKSYIKIKYIVSWEDTGPMAEVIVDDISVIGRDRSANLVRNLFEHSEGFFWCYDDDGVSVLTGHDPEVKANIKEVQRLINEFLKDLKAQIKSETGASRTKLNNLVDEAWELLLDEHIP